MRFLRQLIWLTAFCALLIGCYITYSFINEPRGIFAPKSCIQKEKPIKRVLLLVSYDIGHIWTRDVVSHMHSRANALPWKLFFDVIQLNVSEVNDKNRINDKLNLALQKIDKNQYDMILTLDDEALDLILKQKSHDIKNIPIVFSGYENYSPELYKSHPNITGVIRYFDIAANLHLGIKIWPDSKKVIIFSDSSTETLEKIKKLRDRQGQYKNLELVFWNDATHSQAELLSALANEKEPFFMVVTPWNKLNWNDGAKNYEELGVALAEVLPRPFLSSLNNLIGYGTIGGFMADADLTSIEIMKQIDAVLRNGNAYNTKPFIGSLTPFIDYSKFVESKSSFDNLTADTIFLNMQQSIWTNSPERVWVILLFIILLIFSMAGFVFYSIRYRSLTKKNLLIFKHLPLRVGVIDRKERLLFFHDGEKIISSDNLKKLSDIAELDYNTVSSAFAKAFEQKKIVNIDYSFKGKNRIMRIVPLPPRMYGCESIMWISHDNTELHLAHTKLEDTQIKFQMVLENIPGYILFEDIENELRYVLCNKRCEEVMGIPVDEIIGKNDLELFSNPKEANEFWHDANLAATMDHPLETVNKFTLINGDIRIGRMFRKALTDPTGKRLLFVQVFDITELEHSKQHVEDANKLLHVIVNALPVLFFAKDVDDDYRYLLANQSFSEFAGCPLEQLTGKTDFEIFSKPEAEHFRKADIDIMNNNKLLEFVEVVEGGGDQPLTLRTTKRPFVTADGRRMLLGTTIDITHESELLKNEQLTARALEEITLTPDYLKNLQQTSDKLQHLLKLDRVIIAEWKNADKAINIEYEWHHEKLNSSAYETYNIPTERLIEFRKALEQNNALYIYKNEPDSSQQNPWTEFLHNDDQSTIVVPIMINGQMYGMIGASYHFKKHEFTSHDESKMRSMANLIALAQLRQRQLLKIQNADSERQMILNNINIPIWLYDASGKLLRVNTAVCDIMGLSETELLTEEVAIVAKKSFINQDLPLQEVLSTGKSSQMEVDMLKKRYIIHAEPVYSDSGDVLNIVKYAIDVTELNELTRNEKVINSCMELLMAEDDIDGAINEVLGLICNHLKGSHCYLLLHNEVRQTSKCMNEYASDGEPILFLNLPEMKLNQDEKWYRELEAHKMLFFTDVNSPETIQTMGSWSQFAIQHKLKDILVLGIFIGGKLRGNLGIIHNNITPILSEVDRKFFRAAGHLFELLLDRKKGREELIAALKQSQDASKAKSFFLASMSHEIRTPLNAVIGFAELLKDDTLDVDTQKEFLDSIAKSGNTLLDLINDVLDLSKLEAGQMVFNTVETDFCELCESIMDIFKGIMMTKSLKRELILNEMPNILIDRQRIRQVLFNLIGNAVKFTDSGSIKIEANFTPKNQTLGLLEFRVCDTGIGIDQDDQIKLFEAFVQSKRMRGTFAANQGTGLGLAICRRMLTEMNGEISVISEIGKGTTFIVTINDVEFINSNDQINENQDDSRLLANFDKPVKTPSNLRVMIVDDVAINLKVLSAMLENFGFQVISRNSGNEALIYLKDNQVDLVITDLWMPDMNGAELASAIKTNYNDLPIYALTADIEVEENFDITHFSGIITKPLSKAKLIEGLHLENHI